MRSIHAIERVTLDGVMRSPGDPDEDRRDGFELGGWADPYNDEVLGAEMSEGMGTSELLFGRQTYEMLHAHWSTQPEPNGCTKVLDQTHKYVASRTLAEPLPWVNSTLLEGDATDAVAKLKKRTGKDLTIMGSGVLVRSPDAGRPHRRLDGIDPSARAGIRPTPLRRRQPARHDAAHPLRHLTHGCRDRDLSAGLPCADG
jgi:dihydrofolate reductase